MSTAMRTGARGAAATFGALLLIIMIHEAGHCHGRHSHETGQSDPERDEHQDERRDVRGDVARATDGRALVGEQGRIDKRGFYP